MLVQGGTLSTGSHKIDVNYTTFTLDIPPVVQVGESFLALLVNLLQEINVLMMITGQLLKLLIPQMVVSFVLFIIVSIKTVKSQVQHTHMLSA